MQYKRLLCVINIFTIILSSSLILSSNAFAEKKQIFDKPLKEERVEQSKFGGRMFYPMLGEPSNLIPRLASDSASSEITEKLYIGLLRYNEDLVLEPYAAQKFEVLDEGKKLRFYLRKDIYWSDGVKLTARDVEYTYKMMLDPKTPTVYRSNYEAISKFTVLDDYSFEVEYTKPYAQALLTWAGDIVPKHILEKEDLLKTEYARNPVGAGPYILKEWKFGVRIVLEANKKYFLGEPYIKELVYQFIPDMSTQFLELQAKNIDMMGLTPLQYVFQTTGAKWKEGWNKYKYLSHGYTYLGFNNKHEFFSDARVRRAVSYGINREELVAGALAGMGEPANGPYVPTMWAYNKSVKAVAYNPKKARALLKEAGFIDTNGDGIVEKNGKDFRFSILTNQGNTGRIMAAVIIQARLREIGIDVSIRTVEWAAFLREFIDKRRFDAVLLAWSTTLDPDIFVVWHSSQKDGLNFVNFENKEMDELLEKARIIFNPEKRKEYYDRVQEILYEEQPYSFLYYSYALPIISKKIKGVKEHKTGIGFGSDSWWIAKDTQKNAQKNIQKNMQKNTSKQIKEPTLAP